MQHKLSPFFMKRVQAERKVLNPDLFLSLIYMDTRKQNSEKFTQRNLFSLNSILSVYLSATHCIKVNLLWPFVRYFTLRSLCVNYFTKKVMINVKMSLKSGRDDGISRPKRAGKRNLRTLSWTLQFFPDSRNPRTFVFLWIWTKLSPNLLVRKCFLMCSYSNAS